MVKKKKTDVNKSLEDIKKQLAKFGSDAMRLAKQGEKEIVRLSKEGKLRMDATTLGVKKEHLFYLIGKEYVRSGCPGDKNLKLKKIISELNAADKKEKLLKKSIRKVKKTK